MQHGSTPPLPTPHPNAQDSRAVCARACVCVARPRHGSCFSVQFVRAQLGAAGTSETTPKHIHPGQTGGTPQVFYPREKLLVWRCDWP